MSYSKNLQPELSNTIVNGNIEFYQKTDSLFNTFKDILGIIQYNILIEKSKTSPNVLQSLTDAYIILHENKLVLDDTVTQRLNYEPNNTPQREQSLESILGGNNDALPPITVSQNFVYHYIENFKNLHDALKLFILKKVGERSIYQNISEDIGFTLDQGSKGSFYNIRMDDFFYETSKEGAPTYLPSNVVNKVSENVFKVTQTLSLKTGGMLRNALSDISKSNLAADSAFISDTFDQLKDTKTTKIVTQFGAELGKIIVFYKNLNIREQENNKAQYTNYLANIEDLQNYLDFFNNNINSTTVIDNKVVS